MRLTSLAPFFALALAACGKGESSLFRDPPRPCPPHSQDESIRVPTDFCDGVFADHLGDVRQLVVTAEGIVYVMRSGAPILALRDTDGDYDADAAANVGEVTGPASNGIALRGNYLYADYGDRILRFQLAPGRLRPVGEAQTIVSGLPTGGNAAHGLAIDSAGNLFVSIGSATNVCGAPGPGSDPCAELETRAGVWRFDADTPGQLFSPDARYATGIRDAVGLAIHPRSGRLWLLQLGRDSLDKFPQLFDERALAFNPGEELFQVNQGDDFGWPYCYDELSVGRVLAPEYGGNRRERGRCANTKRAGTSFLADWAPTGILFYDHDRFPLSYRLGAFIAFSGTRRINDFPLGFQVWFIGGTRNGLSLSDVRVFADEFNRGFTITEPEQAAHRPFGMAQGPDGSLYITDDRGGRIYRIWYGGAPAGGVGW